MAKMKGFAATAQQIQYSPHFQIDP